MRKLYIFLIVVVILIGVDLLYQKYKPTPKIIETPTENPVTTQTVKTTVGLANPASVNCEAKGGTLKIEKYEDGGEYGVCYFEDNRQCEEWALFRNECPVGGRKITGYDTKEQIFCAITGGEVDMNKKTCTKAGKVCNTVKYYTGGCN